MSTFTSTAIRSSLQNRYSITTQDIFDNNTLQTNATMSGTNDDNDMSPEKNFKPEMVFDFMGLPPEMRNWICFANLPCGQVFDINHVRRVSTDGSMQLPALLRVSRAVYNEAAPIFFGTNKFKFHAEVDTMDMPQNIKLLLKAHEMSIKWMRHWTIRFNVHLINNPNCTCATAIAGRVKCNFQRRLMEGEAGPFQEGQQCQAETDCEYHLAMEWMKDCYAILANLVESKFRRVRVEDFDEF